MTNIMIDIETLSTKNNAVILTIGAVKFSMKEKEEKEKTKKFYLRIDLQSCIKLKMHIDNNTEKWWKEQSKDAQYEVFENPDRVSIKDALIELSDFIKDAKCIWANSPNFDCIILENAYNSCKLEIPWKFWNLRDCRTLYSLANINLTTFKKINETKYITNHNALDDCIVQILALKESFKILNI
jgi:hypothetical protein